MFLLQNVAFLKFQLKNKAKQTKTVKWLPLGSTIKEPIAGTNCLVAGWGQIKNNAKQISDVLMSVNVTVIDRVKCNSPEYYGLNPVITRSMICAGSNGKNMADTCKVRTLCKGKACHHHLNCYVSINDMLCICLLTPGGFRRATGVQWSTSRSDVLWAEMWRD